ncbi:MAG TPA: hypothetical protein VNI77_06690 [Nitrososphaera sp.]|nr:hypothetical protein [Nitrososphaera sp.]
MVNRADWVRRRWLDFRQGHSVYLIFLMTFANFVTIQFALLIDRIPELKTIFPNLWIFAALFVAGYVPLAIVIGYWHRKSQWKIEQEAMFNENVVQARLWLFMLELIDGTVTEEEKKRVRTMLMQIIKKNAASKNETSSEDRSKLLKQQKDNNE